MASDVGRSAWRRPAVRPVWGGGRRRSASMVPSVCAQVSACRACVCRPEVCPAPLANALHPPKAVRLQLVRGAGLRCSMFGSAGPEGQSCTRSRGCARGGVARSGRVVRRGRAEKHSGLDGLDGCADLPVGLGQRWLPGAGRLCAERTSRLSHPWLVMPAAAIWRLLADGAVARQGRCACIAQAIVCLLIVVAASHAAAVSMVCGASVRCIRSHAARPRRLPPARHGSHLCCACMCEGCPHVCSR